MEKPLEAVTTGLKYEGREKKSRTACIPPRVLLVSTAILIPWWCRCAAKSRNPGNSFT